MDFNIVVPALPPPSTCMQNLLALTVACCGINFYKESWWNSWPPVHMPISVYVKNVTVEGVKADLPQHIIPNLAPHYSQVTWSLMPAIISQLHSQVTEPTIVTCNNGVGPLSELPGRGYV